MKKLLALLLALFISGFTTSCGASFETSVLNSIPVSENSIVSEISETSLESNEVSTYTPTTGQKNALEEAKSYLSVMPFSYDGLVEQLEYEQYTNEEAVYAVSRCGADWDEQAVLCAKSYLKTSAFSFSGLVEQLEYEGFTSSQARHGANNCGADWKEQAAKCAESYLSVSSFSRKRLIEQLEYEGFTHEQAVYGVSQNGY